MFPKPPHTAGRDISGGDTMATRLGLWLRHLAMGLVLGGTALLAGCDMVGSGEPEVA